MAFSLNVSLQDSLKGLLTTAQAQSRNVQFNIQFAALQDTTIKRLNADIIKAEDVTNRQSELDRLQATADKLSERRAQIVKFEFLNAANKQRFGEITKLATNAKIAVELGDGNANALNANEVAAFEKARKDITTKVHRLRELNDPQFFDGNHPTILAEQIAELNELKLVEGAIDPKGSSTPTNDNRKAIDLLGKITLSSAAASDTSSTLNLMADRVIQRMGSQLKKIKTDSTEISVDQALAAEMEVKRLRTKYATFLQAIEIGFDFTSQNTAKMVEAMNSKGFTSNTVASYIV